MSNQKLCRGMMRYLHNMKTYAHREIKNFLVQNYFKEHFTQRTCEQKK